MIKILSSFFLYLFFITSTSFAITETEKKMFFEHCKKNEIKNVQKLLHDQKNTKEYINALDDDGNTALHICAQKKYKALAQILLEHHAESSIKNKAGKTAQDLFTGSKKAEEAFFKKHSSFQWRYIVLGGIASLIGLYGVYVFSTSSDNKIDPTTLPADPKKRIDTLRSLSDQPSILLSSRPSIIHPEPTSALVIHNPQAHAAILNGAIGDTLGVVHKWNRSQNLTVKELADAYRPRFAAAIYSDETVMSRIVLEESLKGGTTAEICDRLAIRFSSLQQSEDGKPRGHGGCNSRAFGWLQSNLSQKDTQNWWKKRYQGKDVGSEGGCGSVMRAWPIGLCFHDYDFIAELAAEQSRITHANNMACAASAAMAVGTAAAYQKESIDDIVDKMVKAAEKYETKKSGSPLPEHQLTQSNLKQFTTSDMIRYAAKMAKENKTPEEILGTNKSTNHGLLLGAAAHEAVSVATYLFVRHCRLGCTVNETMLIAVNSAGDNDCIASLTGVLLGAYTGEVFQDKNIDILEAKEAFETVSEKIK
jgi:ADP-ribosylglycohydrolase